MEWESMTDTDQARAAGRPDKQIVSSGGNVLEPARPWLDLGVVGGGLG